MTTWDKVKKLLGFGPNCKNGGTKDNQGNCRCPKLIEGAICEKYVCLHGGKLVGNGCECPDSGRFYGDHCELTRCDNNGKDTGKGECECLDNWYTGKYCELYSSPWGIVFGTLAGILVILIVLCVFCRLKICNRRRRSRRNTMETGAQSNRHQNRNRDRRLIVEMNPNSRRQNIETQAIRPANHGRSPASAPDWPPWPSRPGEVASIEQPPDYEPKLDSPPPPYHEVIKDLSRYPSTTPSAQDILLPPPRAIQISAPLEANGGRVTMLQQTHLNSLNPNPSDSQAPTTTQRAPPLNAASQRLNNAPASTVTDAIPTVAPTSNERVPEAHVGRTPQVDDVPSGDMEALSSEGNGYDSVDDDGLFDSDYTDDEGHLERPSSHGPVYDSVPKPR